MSEDIVREFKQFFKKNRLAEKEKTLEEKKSIIMKQIKKMLGDIDE